MLSHYSELQALAQASHISLAVVRREGMKPSIAFALVYIKADKLRGSRLLITSFVQSRPSIN